jgi:deoxyribonuclease-4
MKVGLHVSIAGGIDLAVDRALARGCETFQIFTRNPRGWGFDDLGVRAKAFREKVAKSKLEPVAVHMPYLPNLASPTRRIYRASVKSLVSEVRRCELLKARYLVVHLGSHMGSGTRLGSERIAHAISEALSVAGSGTMILLENTSGSRNSMGSSFDEISDILEKVDKAVNVCFDTCHAFASGYDLRNDRAIDGTLSELEKKIGLKRLKVIHINDSKGALGSRLDRHEHIGLGKIGSKGFSSLLAHPRIKEIPLILETPIDRRRDDYGNMRAVRNLANCP